MPMDVKLTRANRFRFVGRISDLKLFTSQSIMKLNSLKHLSILPFVCRVTRCCGEKIMPINFENSLVTCVISTQHLLMIPSLILSDDKEALCTVPSHVYFKYLTIISN